MSRPKTTADLVKRLQDTATSPKERVALQALATEMAHVFGEEKTPQLGHEAAALALVVSPEKYQELLRAFAGAITQGTADGNVLDPHLCKGLIHVLRCSILRDADGHTGTNTDKRRDYRLGTVLSSLKKRLESAVAQGDTHASYQLLLTLGSVLHAMYDAQAAGIDRETLQKPLLDLLDKLTKNKEIRVAQAATYAYEALRCIPDSDGPYKILLHNLVGVVGAVSKIAGAVMTMDASKLFDGAVELGDVPDLVSAMVDVVESLSVAAGNLKDAKDVARRQRKSKSWYVALRYSDMLVQNRAFASLGCFLEKVPCRHDIDFLCGISAQLEEAWLQMAADATRTNTNTTADTSTDKGTDGDCAQSLAMRARIQDILASLPEPKSRSDPVHGVVGGLSDNQKRFTAWKDAVTGTVLCETRQPNKDRKNKDYVDSLGCYIITAEVLPSELLLMKAWRRCTRAQLYYADVGLRQYYLANDERILKIERLSGAPLPMKHCYVNLNIKKATKPSDETMPLHRIFDPCTCNDGTIRVPRRLLIRGTAGVGKSTLCKKIVYELTRSPVSPEFQTWTSAYDRVIWLPLRNLKRYSAGTIKGLKDLFNEEYMHSLADGKDLARALHDHCSASNGNNRKSSRTLFLLDGLDEMSQQLDPENQAAAFLTRLLEQPDVIITSRPGARMPEALELTPLDCELETTGFDRGQVRQYVRYSLSTRPRVESFLWFLHRHPFLSNIVKIPLQLDALCYIWEDKNADSGNDLFKNTAHSTTTSTAIYLAIEDKLWRKDIPRLEICDSRGKPATKSRVRAFRTQEQIRELVRVEASFLQSLAFSGLVSETLYFDERYCDSVKTHMDAPHLRLTGSVDDVLLNVSCLRTLETSIASMPPDQTATMDLHRTYHFIHLTYQEFFAAHYFVACWTAGKDLAFVTSKKSQKQVIGTDEFIADHKYDTRYSVFWRFVAGLLRSGIHSLTDNSGTACLGRFFYALEREPRDILGFEHQKLVVQCLVEADPAQDMALFDPHRSLLKEWVAYEYNRSYGVRLLRMIPFAERISGLIVPDETGNLVVRNTSLIWSNMIGLSLPLQDVPPNLSFINAEGRMPPATVQILYKLPFLPPDALQAITEHLQRSPINYSENSLYVPSHHLDDVVPCILDCFRHTRGFVRANAAIVCANIAHVNGSLPLEVVAALVHCVDDAFKRAAFYAMFALCKVQPFPQDAVGAICAQLRNRKKSVRMSAAKAVVQAEMLHMEVFQKITSLLLDPAPGVRSAAMKVFRARQDPLPDSVVAQLAQFLGSPNEAETAAAVDLLRRDPRAVRTLMRASRLHRDDDASNTHRPVLDELIVLLHNGSTPQIRAAAAQLFQRTVGPLPAHIYEQLARGLADPSFDVRGYVAVALSHHTSPFVPGVDRIVLDVLSQAEKFPHKIKLHLFRFFPTNLPLSPATMHVLAPKMWDVRTASYIRKWILAVFRSRRGRLPESIMQTLAGFQQSHFLANSMPDSQHSTALEQVTKYRPLDDFYIGALEAIAYVFAECPSLPGGVVSSLLEQLSSGDGDGKYSIALRSCSTIIITALSHPELVSQPVLTGILSCLASSDVRTRDQAEYTLYQKSTLPLNILQPLLEYTMRDKGALEDLIFPKDLFQHIAALPDAELASLFSAGNEYARFVLEDCLHRSLAYERHVLCYADGESHYEFVFRGKRRRIPKTCFPVNPKHILRELGVPVGLPRVGEEKMAETVQGGKGEDGQKGDGGDDEKYRSGHIFVIFVVLFIWASFYFSSVY